MILLKRPLYLSKRPLKVFNIKTTFKDPSNNDRYNNNVNYLNNLFYNTRTSSISGEELSILITNKFGPRYNLEIVTKDKITYIHIKDEPKKYKMSYYNEIASLINSYGDPEYVRNMLLQLDIKIIGDIMMEIPIIENI
jgi:hypothetical protein